MGTIDLSANPELRQRLAELLAKWQGILRLKDWDIKTEVVHREWRKSGDIKIDAEDRKAVLLVNERPKSDNLDEEVGRPGSSRRQGPRQAAPGRAHDT